MPGVLQTIFPINILPGNRYLRATELAPVLPAKVTPSLTIVY
jgi:hypothetical protein